MKLHEVKYTEGARQKSYRVGRGHGSGNGETAGRGHKGQNTRSDGSVRLGFEGGQTPLARRSSKRGFTNFNRKEYAIVNVISLDGSEDGTEVTPELLTECGLVKKELDGIKILGEGELERRLGVKVGKFSKSAITIIEQTGGEAEVI